MSWVYWLFEKADKGAKIDTAALGKLSRNHAKGMSVVCTGMYMVDEDVI